MRVQSDGKVRACPLSPPVIVLKQKKPSRVFLNVLTVEPVVSSVALTPEDCLSHLDIRVGRIVKAWNHPDSEK